MGYVGEIKKTVLAVSLGFALLPSAFAEKGHISFSAREKADHAQRAHIVAQVSGECLNSVWNDHVRFYKKNGVSKFFGNRRYKKGWKNGVRPKKSYEKEDSVIYALGPLLKKMGKNPKLMDQMENMSCVDLSRKCLREGFKAAGQLKYWQRISEFNDLNGNKGTTIQMGLQALGWKMLYWNPAPELNDNWDSIDVDVNSQHVMAGQNAAHYRNVMSRGRYYTYKVDDRDTLVNFGTRTPESLTRIPFFMGTANTGYHVFVGANGEVIEAHSTRDITSFQNLERNMFNPLAGQPQSLSESNALIKRIKDAGKSLKDYPGGPLGPVSTRSERYNSGLIVVPPGYL